MSWLATVALSSDTDAPDWVAAMSYHNASVDFFDNTKGLKSDNNGRCVFSGNGSPGTGIGCLSEFGGFTAISGSNGYTVSGGGVYSPEAILTKDNNGTVYGIYTLTHDSTVPGSTTQSFTVLSFNSSTGATTLFTYGRGDYSFPDAPTTTMTSGGFDSSNNFYAVGRIRQSGGYEYPYLIKYNSSAVIQWSKALQPSQNQYSGSGYTTLASSVVVDSSGNSYVAVLHYTNPPATTNVIKLLKYNSSGVQQVGS